MNSRKLARETLAGLLETITTFVAVFDEPPGDTGNLSPIGFVENVSTGWVNDTFGTFQRAHRLNVHIWWARGDTDAATTNEDRMDDLSEAVFGVLEANLSVTGVWDSLMIDELGSILGYTVPEDEDGLIYRVETIPVTVW